MAPADNPAGRLFHLLQDFMKAGRRNGVSIRQAWSKTFGLDPADVTSTFQHIAEVQKLVRDTRQTLETEADASHGPFLQHFSKIESFVAQTNLDANSNSLISNYLQDIVMRDLEFASHHLSKTSGEEVIEEDAIASFLEDINTAARKLYSSDLEPALRIVLLDLLEAMRHAVAQYRIHGAEAFRKALILCIGEIGLVKEEFERNKDKEEVKDFGVAMGKLMGLAKHANTLSTLALNVHKIVALLPPGVGGGS